MDRIDDVTYLNTGEVLLEACLVWVMDFVAWISVRLKTQKTMPVHWSKDCGYDRYYSKPTFDSDLHWILSLMKLKISEGVIWDK